MKKILLFLLLTVSSFYAFSQQERPTQNNGNNRFRIKKIKVKEVKEKNFGGSNASNSVNTSARTGSPVGVTGTKGELSVSLTGGATYTIPLDLPKGAAGIEPDISLSYNSQGNNGVAGYGWNIHGISQISRIPATVYHDGLKDPVDYDSNDRFALDGQRLILESGTYGEDGATYRTENYSNILVKSVGSNLDGTGPKHFEVEYPDGSTASFGSAYADRTAKVYGISYWENPQGIRITYDYIRHLNTLTIEEITYGAKSLGIHRIEFQYKDRTRKEQSFMGGVIFSREDLLSEIIIHGNNTPYKRYKLTHDSNNLGYDRLTSVQEFSGDQSESYSPINFNYSDTGDSVNGKDVTYDDSYGLLMSNIEQRNAYATSFDLTGNGNMDFTIHPKTKSERDKFWLFEDVRENNPGSFNYAYKVEMNGIFEELFPAKVLNYQDKVLSGQGIGVMDFSGSSDVNFTILVHSLSSPLIYQYERTWSAPTYQNEIDCDREGFENRIPREFLQGDFNGDGLTDVIAIDKPYSKNSCYPVLGSPTDPCGLQPLNQTDDNLKKTDSVNNTKSKTEGDKRIAPIDSDCCRCEYQSYNSARVTFINLDRRITSGFADYAGYLQSNMNGSELKTGDFNGDGKTDILKIMEGKIEVYGLNSSENIQLLWSTTSSYIKRDMPLFLGDYNGDGLVDFLIPSADGSYYFSLFRSTGESFQRNGATYDFRYQDTNWDYDDQTLYGYNLIPTDINGDGKTDIIDFRTKTYNSSNYGYQYLDVHRNISNASDGHPDFESGTSISNYGKLKHFPIPIFLGSRQANTSLDFATISNDQVSAYEFNLDNREDMLLRGVSQNGISKSIIYRNLTNEVSGFDYSSVYSYASDEIYPYVDVQYGKGLKVVSGLTQSGANLPYLKKFYSYHGAVFHQQGLGFLGFKGIASSNWYESSSDRLYTVSKYDPKYRGVPIMDYTTADYISFHSVPSNYANKSTYNYNYNVQSNKIYKLEKTSTLIENGLKGTSSLTTYTYNNYMMPTKVVTTYGPDSKKEIIITYSTSSVEQELSRNIIMTNFNSGDSFSSNELYTYNNHLMTQKRTKGDQTDYITDNYTYDTYGNRTSVTTSANGVTSRSINTEYDSSGRFLIKKIDETGEETTYTYDQNSGVMLSETELGKTTTFQYDKMFREISQTDYLGNQTTTNYHENSSSYVVTTSSDNGSGTELIFDGLGRKIKSGYINVLGNWVYKSFEYDKYDQLVKESEPYTGSASKWNQQEYDRYGRKISSISASGKTISFSYNDNVTVIDYGNRTESITKDSFGNVISKTDDGGTVTYQYSGNNKLIQASLSGNSITIERDGWGRKTKLIDPSAGTYITQYNNFGEITKEITPLGESTYTYDQFGRKTKRVVSGQNSDMTILYSYGSNKLLQAIDVTSADGNNISYEYGYDAHNRLDFQQEDTPYAKFEKTYTYDAKGKLYTVNNYALDKNSGKSNQVKVRNNYDHGKLKKILDDSSGEILWEITSLTPEGFKDEVKLGGNQLQKSQYDAYGFVTEIESVLENGSGSSSQLMSLTFDFDNQTGNLESRYNSLFNWSESFSYDSLERLTDYDDNSGAHNQSYDPLGKILSNTGIGTFSYAGNSYRQSSINFNNNGASYYNNLEAQHISYNVFNAPVEINETGVERVSFEYNAFEKRSNVFYGNTNADKNQRPLRKHYSFDGSMEIKYNSQTNTTEFVTFIGGDAYNAPLIHYSKGSSSTEEFKFLHRDYLGSILAITDENGNVDEKRHFDAWGNIVKIQDGSGNDITEFQFLDRGYTGHEHLIGVALIHMNGRIYDPMLHRFINPDNNIQDAFNSQNFNRYGYALNNPLKYKDPGGEFLVAALIGAAIGVVMNGISNSIQGKGFFKGAVGAAFFGAIGGAASFGIGQIAGSIAQSLTGSSISGLIVGGFQAGSHALLGGTLSVVQGGDFAAGALSGALSSAVATGVSGIKNLSKVLNAAVKIGSSGVSGGVGSVIAGGNFIDGFRQGLISGGLNHGVHAGWFGQNIAMAAITGRTRHIFGPDATAISGNISAGVGLGISAEKGALFMLRGQDAGKIFAFDDWGLGASLASASGSIEICKLYYSGNSDFSKDVFYGTRLEANLAVDAGISVGVTGLYSSLDNGNFVIGLGANAGVGASLTILDVNINFGETTTKLFR